MIEKKPLLSRSGLLLAMLLAILSTAATASVALAAAMDELRVSYSAMPLNAPSIVSARLDMVSNMFKTEDIELRYLPFSTGPQMTEAFAAKDLDIASVMGATSAIVARAAGVDVKVIAAYSMNPAGFALVVPMGSRAKSPEDLKGRLIGGPKGTAAHQLLLEISAASKMSIKDFDFANMTVPDAAAAIVAGQLDGALLVEPYLTKLLESRKVRVLRDGTGLIGGLTVVVARGDLVKGQKAVLRRFLRAHQQAVNYLTTHLAESIDAVSKETKLSPEQVRRLLPRYDFDPSLRPEVLAELRECADFLFDAGMIKKRVDVDDLIAPGLL